MFWNTDAGVFDIKAQVHFIVSGSRHLDTKSNTAFRGEFDGVAEHIPQNLSQPCAISNDPMRDRTVGVEIQIQPF